MSYEHDRRLEDKFGWLIRSILAQQFIAKDDILDLEQATDFTIFTIKPFKVAVRLRRFQYFEAFHNEFTIRYSRPSGVKTEIHKIKEGLVNYLMYGFLDKEEKDIIQYFIADLKFFGNIEPYKIFPNNPNDSELAVYKLSQFPKQFILKFYRHSQYSYVKNIYEQFA